MLLSRIQTNACIRSELLKRSSRYFIPRNTLLINSSNGQRSIKTFSARLAEESTNSFPKSVTKSTLNDISAREQTAQLYLDNVFPLRMGMIDIRQIVFRNSKHFLETRVQHAIPSNILPNEFTIKEIVARTKDGGAIVSFAFKSPDEKKVEIASDIVARINEYIKNNKVVAPFNFQTVRAFLVKGQPFMEDILARYPTQRLRIEFQGEAVSVEKLYKHLRPFGKLFDILLYPNPTVNKDPARYALAQFTRIRSATSARNCLHGLTIDGTRINILYERQLRTNIVKDWLISHPRITVPLMAAIFAGATYAVFDPIRVFCVSSKITQRFNLEEYAIYRWLRKETWARLIPGGAAHDLSGSSGSVWADDAEQNEKLVSRLSETPETFVLVTGHKGSGKSALVKSAIKDRKNKLFIDCANIANARNQSEMTKNLAKEVGYYPVFTWSSSMSGMIDTALAATTGQKTGLSSTPDSQIKSILETVAIALRDVVPSEKEARIRVEEEVQRENFLHKIKSILTTGSENKAKTIKPNPNNEKSSDEADEDKLDQKSIPIVVIDNYMYRETAKNAKLWDELAEWAALLIENEIAHVVFVSSNASVMKTLGKALPGKSFSNVALSDAPPEIALSFINKQLGSEVEDPSLHDVVSALGGRLTELELLVQKMKMKMDAQTAFEDIVTRNLIEIRKYGFGDSSVDNYIMEWTATQFWTIVKLLAKNKSVRESFFFFVFLFLFFYYYCHIYFISIQINYDELKWGSIFNGNDAPLKAMERAELIVIVQKEGRPNSIRPGKPVYYTVFNRLVSDELFTASMEVESNMALKKQTEDAVTKLEDTIEKLSQINSPSRPPKEIEARIRFLLNKVNDSQKSIEEYDNNIKIAKETISKVWVDNDF
ncbi:RNA12 protein-domain-containing protein [Cokeromyces recurvatus]|uniref:RNA12 protein-domain-containing protein n=1 Tax=Cokeromyces recurvatus TaxID=90255 RepID=UPI00221F0EDF|nr:RNA12 protein-domain-containing protein [Cokeromyces recurvatus]KAI7905156.1 RNA12 protein-domain-containing protein [Cokeromyces recurvatus]